MINLIVHANSLEIELKDMDYFVDLEPHKHDDIYVLSEMLEYGGYMGNGWNARVASDFGHLSEAPCVTLMEETDDDGNLISSGTLYYWGGYEVTSVYEELENEGKIFLTKL